jgi:hypothetical protein
MAVLHRLEGASVVLGFQNQKRKSSTAEGTGDVCIHLLAAPGDLARALKARSEGHTGLEQNWVWCAERIWSCVSRSPQTTQGSGRAVRTT